VAKYGGLIFVGCLKSGGIRKRKPLDTLSRIEGLMKSPLTDTYHRYGWLQAYGDLGLKSPFFIVRIIGDVAQLCQYEEPPFLALLHPSRLTDCGIDLWYCFVKVFT
jgi:hypothetical protein